MKQKKITQEAGLLPIATDMKSTIKEALTIPEGADVSKQGNIFIVKGPKGEIKREFANARIEIKVDGNKLLLSSKKATKREKALLYTFVAHLRNMINGVKEPSTYKLKICSSHFPMNVSISGNQLVVKNFLGEKTPRTLNIKHGVDVKIAGDEITVASCDKELAGMTASAIELLTAVKNKDLRVFQEGIYIVEKA